MTTTSTKDLTYDLLKSKKIRLLDIWDFAKFIKEHESDITLDDFLDRLADEAYHLTADEWLSGDELNRKFYCVIIEQEPDDETRT